MSDKVFLLGVGAQKCGTSWLHDVLAGSPQADMGLCKEYHIHDALTLPDCARFRDRTLKQLALLTARGTPPARESKLALRAAFLTDPSAYYEYFQRLLDAPGMTLTGDFTPSYSGLSVQTLGGVKTQLQAHGMQPKVVFLMRDPVERSWSALRMSRRKVLEKNPQHSFAQDEFEQLRRMYRKPSFELRAQYTDTLARLAQVFAPEDIFVEFYERLFSKDVTDSICDFAGIGPVDADLAKRVNVSPKTAQLPDDLAFEMAQHYADIYRELAGFYGTEFIMDLWGSARFVLNVATPFRTVRG